MEEELIISKLIITLQWVWPRNELCKQKFFERLYDNYQDHSAPRDGAELQCCHWDIPAPAGPVYHVSSPAIKTTWGDFEIENELNYQDLIEL